MHDLPQDHNEPLGSFSRHFADFIIKMEGKDVPGLRRASQMLSHSVSEGNTCLDLEDLAHLSDSDLSFEKWSEYLRSATVVGGPDDYAPLVFDSPRLYLHRYYHYEKMITSNIHSRMGIDVSDLDIALLKEGLARLFPGKAGDGGTSSTVFLFF